jgi:hypothetical protein
MKLSRLWMLAVASALVSSAGARDITTTTGDIYHNAVVTKVQPDGIRIVHDDGAGFVDFQILTEQERKEFGFNPTAYAVAEKEEADFAKRLRDLHLLAAQQALLRAKQAAEAALAYAAQAPPPRWPTTIDVGLQTPDFSYDNFGGSGWNSYVPSTFYSTSSFGSGYRTGFGGRFGFGGAGSTSFAGRRR